MSLRVGLVDSGIGGGAAAAVIAKNAAAQTPPALMHGTVLANIIRAHCPTVALLDARVFTNQLSCTAHDAAMAIGWLIEQKAQLINLSLGLRRDVPELRAACERAIEQGAVLVASAPAQGDPVFPATYSGVISATGDARCQPGEISWLKSQRAEFAGCVQSDEATVRGASVGCAAVSAALAVLMTESPSASRDEWLSRLRNQARYVGPERRR